MKKSHFNKFSVVLHEVETRDNISRHGQSALSLHTEPYHHLGNKMGHHTLLIKRIHPYSIKQTSSTRSNTTRSSAPEPCRSRLWHRVSAVLQTRPHNTWPAIVLYTVATIIWLKQEFCRWLLQHATGFTTCSVTHKNNPQSNAGRIYGRLS